MISCKKNHSLLILVLCGLFIPFLSLTFYNLSWLAFVSYVIPFYHVINYGCSSKKDLLKYSIFSLSIMISSSWGIFYYSIILGSVVIIFQSLKYLLMIIIINKYFDLSKSKVTQTIQISTIWTLIEVVYNHIPYSTNLSPVLMLATNNDLLGMLKVTGQSGIIFCLIFINLSISINILDIVKKKLRKESLISLPVCLIMIIALHGNYGLEKIKKQGDLIPFTVVQASISKDKYKRASYNPEVLSHIAEEYFNMTREALKNGSKNIIWPESAIGQRYHRVQKRINNLFLSKDKNLNLIAGFPFQKNSIKTNSAIYLDDGKLKAKYDKNYVIPIAEREFNSTKNNKALKTKMGTIGTPICFEILSLDVIRNFIRERTEFLTKLSGIKGLTRFGCFLEVSDHYIFDLDVDKYDQFSSILSSTFIFSLLVYKFIRDFRKTSIIK